MGIQGPSFGDDDTNRYSTLKYNYKKNIQGKIYETLTPLAASKQYQSTLPTLHLHQPMLGPLALHPVRLLDSPCT